MQKILSECVKKYIILSRRPTDGAAYCHNLKKVYSLKHIVLLYIILIHVPDFHLSDQDVQWLLSSPGPSQGWQIDLTHWGQENIRKNIDYKTLG